jgi:hypothetical protein
MHALQAGTDISNRNSTMDILLGSAVRLLPFVGDIKAQRQYVYTAEVRLHYCTIVLLLYVCLLLLTVGNRLWMQS